MYGYLRDGYRDVPVPRALKRRGRSARYHGSPSRHGSNDFAAASLTRAGRAMEV